MHDSIVTTGYSDGEIDTNDNGNRDLASVVSQRLSRRNAMFSGMTASALAFCGSSVLAGCTSDEGESSGVAPLAQPGGVTLARTGQMVSLAALPGATGEWVQVSGPEVELATAGRSAAFIAPAVEGPVELVFAAAGAQAQQGASRTIVKVGPAHLSFTAIAKNRNDLVTVPAGYSVTVMTRVGDPIAAGVAAYRNDGTDTDFAHRIGDHGDALYYYGLGRNGERNDRYSKRGLLVQNHENLNVQYLHPNGPTNVSSGPRPEAEAIKEIEAHGVSVIEYRDKGDRQWEWVQDSTFNRRITPNTPVEFRGPVRGADFLKTAYSTDGTQGRGTINNCANGHTLWGTNLTCEENWAGYFRRSGDDAARTPRELTALRRYGVSGSIEPPHRPEPTRVEASPPLGLDFGRAGIRTILWATGFRPDYSWLEVPVLDPKGNLRHDGGVVTEAPGLYVLGLPFLRRRKSSLMDGAGDDTRDLSAHLAAHLGARSAVL